MKRDGITKLIGPLFVVLLAEQHWFTAMASPIPRNSRSINHRCAWYKVCISHGVNSVTERNNIHKYYAFRAYRLLFEGNFVKNIVAMSVISQDLILPSNWLYT